jgi:hypothetical protein
VARRERFEFSTSDVANWRWWLDRALLCAAMGRVCGAWIEGDAGSRKRGRGIGLRVFQRSGNGLPTDQGIGAEAGEVLGVVHGRMQHTVSIRWKRVGCP